MVRERERKDFNIVALLEEDLFMARDVEEVGGVEGDEEAQDLRVESLGRWRGETTGVR
jgi:hypothetical protein